MAAMLRDFRRRRRRRVRPRAIPLAMIAMRKSAHGFPSVSHLGLALRLAALRQGAPLLMQLCFV